MEDLNKIRERIKKLLALAAGGNENEAALALSAAQRLMDEYRISSIELETSKIENIIQDNIPFLEGMTRQWKLILINQLAKYNNCKVIAFKNGRTSNVIGFGKQSDLDYLRFIFSQTIVILTRISKIACMFEKRTYYDAWFLGAVSGISDRLREERKVLIKDTVNKFALVKFTNQLQEVEDFVNNLYSGLKSIKSKGTKDTDAFNAGYKKGKELDLNSKNEISGHLDAIGMR